MLCLRSLASYLLAAVAFSCLSAYPLLTGPVLQTHDSVPNGASHRGSGRLVTHQSLTSDGIAYRGTGRINTMSDHIVAHRGSGRIEGQTTDSDKSAYRGSGRIMPHNTQSPEFA